LNKKTGSTILFISQGTIGKQLGMLAKDLSKLSQRQIVYKLHPGEVQDGQIRYLNLYNSDKILVDDEIASDLYQRIFEAEIVIGVHSTALIEAASLGKRVIVVGLPGWENFKELINDDSIPIQYSEAVPKKLLEMILNSREERKEIQKPLIEPYDNSFLNLASDTSG
jgi:hypothetical protein